MCVRRPRPYRRPTGRETAKLEREAVQRGERLDLEAVRELTRNSEQWAARQSTGTVAKRGELLADLVRLAREHALPFNLGTFDVSADVAPLSTLVATVPWIGQPRARRRAPDGPRYSSVHLAGNEGDVSTNQPDDFSGTLFDDYLELFFDWVLPLAMVNGAIRRRALDKVDEVKADLSSATKRIIHDNRKKIGESGLINDCIAPHLNDRYSAEQLISGRTTVEPSEDVLRVYRLKLESLADKIAAMHPGDAALLRERLDALAPLLGADSPGTPEKYTRLPVIEQEHLEGIADKRAGADPLEANDARAEIAEDRVKDEGPPTVDEYEAASRRLMAKIGERSRRHGGDAGPALAVLAAALPCLRAAHRGEFVGSGGSEWRAFVYAWGAQQQWEGQPPDPDDVADATIELIEEAVLGRGEG